MYGKDPLIKISYSWHIRHVSPWMSLYIFCLSEKKAFAAHDVQKEQKDVGWCIPAKYRGSIVGRSFWTGSTAGWRKEQRRTNRGYKALLSFRPYWLRENPHFRWTPTPSIFILFTTTERQTDITMSSVRYSRCISRISLSGASVTATIQFKHDRRIGFMSDLAKNV